MTRHWVYALAAVVLLPCLAQAQSDAGWGPVFRVTPFIGVSPGITQKGDALVFHDNGSVVRHNYEIEYDSSLPLGVNLEYRFWDRFSAIAGGVWSQRPSGKLTDFDDELVYEIDGTNLWMAKAGLAMRLREVDPDMQLRRLNASIFLAPAFIHDKPKTDASTPVPATLAINHWGLNMGAEAELPLANNRLAFTAGLENWMIFWDDEGYRDRIEPYVMRFNNTVDAVTVDGNRTNLWLLRFGLSFRF